MNFDLARIPKCIEHHAVFFKKHFNLIHTGKSLGTMLAAAYYSNDMLENVVVQATAILEDLVRDPVETLMRQQPSHYFFVKHIRHMALSIIQLSNLANPTSVFCQGFKEHARSISDSHLKILDLQLMFLLAQHSSNQTALHGRSYWLYLKDITDTLRNYYGCIRDFKKLDKENADQSDETFLREAFIIERVREVSSRWSAALTYHRAVLSRTPTSNFRQVSLSYQDHTDLIGEHYHSPCSPYLNATLPEKIVGHSLPPRTASTSQDPTYLFLLSLEL